MKPDACLTVLAIDTCLDACQGAIVRGATTLAVISEPMVRGHQERVATLVRDLADQAGLGVSDIDLIGVTVGPGSFTGLRVGLAFAKGLALALDRPCVGVGTLEALAASGPGEANRVALIDAGRGRIFAQMFGAGPGPGGPEVMDLAELQSKLLKAYPSGDFMLVGPGAHLVAPRWPSCHLAGLSLPDPIALAHLAARAPRVLARPLYLRAPDAVPRRPGLGS